MQCDACGCSHFRDDPIDDVDAACDCECHIADEYEEYEEGDFEDDY